MNQIIEFVQDAATNAATACDTWLDFVAKETGSLAWPIVALIFVFTFRKEIARAIDRIRSIGKGGAQFDPQQGSLPLSVRLLPAGEALLPYMAGQRLAAKFHRLADKARNGTPVTENPRTATGHAALWTKPSLCLRDGATHVSPHGN